MMNQSLETMNTQDSYENNSFFLQFSSGLSLFLCRGSILGDDEPLPEAGENGDPMQPPVRRMVSRRETPFSPKG